MYSIKKFWSTNTDEAVVISILRNKNKKDMEVLMHLNAQMKGVYLYLFNTNIKKGGKTLSANQISKIAVYLEDYIRES